MTGDLLILLGGATLLLFLTVVIVGQRLQRQGRTILTQTDGRLQRIEQLNAVLQARLDDALAERSETIIQALQQRQAPQ